MSGITRLWQTEHVTIKNTTLQSPIYQKNIIAIWTGKMFGDKWESAWGVQTDGYVVQCTAW